MPLKFCANLSFLFTEAPFLERFALAAAAGFRGVEYLFPYEYPPEVIDECLRGAGLTQVLFNLPAGDWEGGERGIACHPGREEEFRQGLALAIRYAQVLGCRQLHALAGLQPPAADADAVHATYIANLRHAADATAAAGIRLLIEPINSRIDMPGYWLDTPAKAMAAIAEVGHGNLFLQFDIYHAQIMTGDLTRQLSACASRLGHVQVADNPGRHEPGSGEINFEHLFRHLEALGYEGWIGCEYRPRTGTQAGLEWAKGRL